MLDMGLTIASYRIASEIEILKWRRPFRKLLGKTEKNLMKCYLFHICILLRALWTALESCNPYVNYI